MNNFQKNIKRLFDIVFSILGLLISWPVILVFIFISRFYFKENGLFRQIRIGYNAKEFTIFKIKSFKSSVRKINKISRYGFFLRRSKIDELPQLYNVLKGDMSIVGPRPDVHGYADKLTGSDKIILTVKPGLTGPATIFYRNEEDLLSNKENPKDYNIEVIWPKKVELNKAYVENYSFIKDLYYIYKTLV